MGEYEPNDSRNVTGTASTPDGRWTGQAADEPSRRDNLGRDHKQQQMQQGQQGGSQSGQGQMGGASDQSIQFEPDPQLAREVESGQQQGQMGQGGSSAQQGGQDSIGQQNDGVSNASNQQNDHTSGIGQEQQFQAPGSGQQGGMSGATGVADRIREHMEVVDQSGNHIGTVDCVQGEELVLTKSDSPSGEHRRIPLSQVTGIESGRVRLNSRGGA